MKEGDHSSLQQLLKTPEWKKYEDTIRHEARITRLMADNTELSTEARSHYLAKAHGLEEAVELPYQWLSEKIT